MSEETPVAVSAANKHLVTMPGRSKSLADYQREREEASTSARDGPTARRPRLRSIRSSTSDLRRSMALAIEQWSH